MRCEFKLLGNLSGDNNFVTFVLGQRYIRVCKSGLREHFEFPYDFENLYIVFSNRRSADSYRVHYSPKLDHCDFVRLDSKVRSHYNLELTQSFMAEVRKWRKLRRPLYISLEYTE